MMMIFYEYDDYRIFFNNHEYWPCHIQLDSTNIIKGMMIINIIIKI